MKEINAQLEKKYGTKIGGQKVSYYVPVNTLFWSFRVMVGFGSLLFLVSLCGLIATRRGRTAMYEKRWVMWLFGLLTFSPFLANTTGWMITEFGRYPWTVCTGSSRLPNPFRQTFPLRPCSFLTLSTSYSSLV